MKITREMMEAWKKTTDRLYKRIVVETIGMGLCVVILLALSAPALGLSAPRWPLVIPTAFLMLSVIADAIRLNFLNRKLILKWNYDKSPWIEMK